MIHQVHFKALKFAKKRPQGGIVSSSWRQQSPNMLIHKKFPVEKSWAYVYMIKCGKICSNIQKSVRWRLYNAISHKIRLITANNNVHSVHLSKLSQFIYIWYLKSAFKWFNLAKYVQICQNLPIDVILTSFQRHKSQNMIIQCQ